MDDNIDEQINGEGNDRNGDRIADQFDGPLDDEFEEFEMGDDDELGEDEDSGTSSGDPVYHPFNNPCNELAPEDVIRKAYQYSAFRLADCPLLGRGRDGVSGVESCTLVEHGSKLWAYGGTDQWDNLRGTVLVYDLKLSAWRVSTHSNHPPPRMLHTATCYEDSMFVYAGSDQSGPLGDLWEFNFPSEVWIPWITREGPKPRPLNRQEHGASICEGTLIIFGGMDEEQIALDDMWFVNIASKPRSGQPRFERLKFYGKCPSRVHNSHTTVGDSIFAWEWGTLALMRFKHESKTWNKVFYDEVVTGQLLVYKHPTVVAFGGMVNGTVANELKVWDKTSEEEERLLRFWYCNSKQSEEEPSCRRNAAGVAVGDSLYLFGGIDDDDDRLNDLWCLKIWEVDVSGDPVSGS